MNHGEAAEQVVNMSLDGIKVAAKITGEGAKELAVLIYTIMKNKEQTSGKTKLSNMLKTGKPLSIYSIRNEDLAQFQKEAKRYGILYCALIDKKNKDKDGIVDIIVRQEDSGRINRIVERFKLSDFNKGEIITEIEKDRDVKVPHLKEKDEKSQSKNFSKDKNSLMGDFKNKKTSVKEKLDKYKEFVKKQNDVKDKMKSQTKKFSRRKLNDR